jgi:hypothetical protein
MEENFNSETVEEAIRRKNSERLFYSGGGGA